MQAARPAASARERTVRGGDEGVHSDDDDSRTDACTQVLAAASKSQHDALI